MDIGDIVRRTRQSGLKEAYDGEASHCGQTP